MSILSCKGDWQSENVNGIAMNDLDLLWFNPSGLDTLLSWIKLMFCWQGRNLLEAGNGFYHIPLESYLNIMLWRHIISIKFKRTGIEVWVSRIFKTGRSTGMWWIPKTVSGRSQKIAEKNNKSPNVPFAILILCEPSLPLQAEPQSFLPAPVALYTHLDHTHQQEFIVSLLCPGPMLGIFLYQFWETSHGFLLSSDSGHSWKVMQVNL